MIGPTILLRSKYDRLFEETLVTAHLGIERRVFDAAGELHVRKAGDVRIDQVGLALSLKDGRVMLKEEYERTGSTLGFAALASTPMSAQQIHPIVAVVGLRASFS